LLSENALEQGKIMARMFQLAILDKKGKIMTNRISIAIMLVIALTISVTTIKADLTREQNAILNAEKWLSIVDSEKYGDSWGMAAIFFKNSVPKEQWISSMETYRKPLGKMIERKLTSNQYMTNIPGAPDGEYVVIQFKTAFENKTEVIETITPMLDNDGVWRVSGYFIK